MNGTCCGCRDEADAPRPTSVGRRLLEGVQWAVPGAMLALMPKCPMCLAAYIAIGTGVGVSATTASWLRMGLIAGCVGSLLYLAARRVHGFVTTSDHKPGTSLRVPGSIRINGTPNREPL
jgi:hypothetical protein